MRDTQRQKTYNAERAALAHLSAYQEHFDTLQKCQDFADAVTASQTWHSLKGPPNVRVKAMRKLGRHIRGRVRKTSWLGLIKNYGTRTIIAAKTTGLTRYKKDPISNEIIFDHIALAPPEPKNKIIGGWDSLTLLHELAHVVNNYGEKHGDAFRMTHLALMQAVYGDTARAHLMAAYRAENLPVKADNL